MHNVCNISMPQAICDVISSIGIGIGAAAADSIGYRAPARYRSNPIQYFFQYSQFRYIQCQYRYSHFRYIQNIGTVHFGT